MSKKRYAEDPEFRARAIKRATEWNRKNKQRRKKTTDAWLAANPEQRRATVAKYYANNPEKYAEDVRVRRARLGEGPDPEVVARVLRARVCCYCGVGIHNDTRRRGQPIHPCKATIDHLLPVARGGSNEEENLVAACYACNLQKGVRTAVEFLDAIAASSR